MVFSGLAYAAVATVSAGVAQTITLPTSTVTLTGTATAIAPQVIAGYSWAQTSGPTSAIATPTTASTLVSGLTTAGSYVFTLTASDNSTVPVTATSTVTITVNPAITNPVVNAGPTQTIISPASTVSLTGSAQVAVGRTITFNWVQTSGPTSVITTPTTASTSVSGLTAVGIYVYTLTVTDNTSATGSASVTINKNEFSSSTTKPQKMKLEINPNGKVNLQGTLQSITGSVLTVKVWGITFTINTASSKFDGRVKDLSLYKLGDSVSVKGNIDVAASTPTINARSVKNASIETLKENKNRENEKKSENSDKNKKKDNDRNQR